MCCRFGPVGCSWWPCWDHIQLSNLGWRAAECPTWHTMIWTSTTGVYVSHGASWGHPWTLTCGSKIGLRHPSRCIGLGWNSVMSRAATAYAKHLLTVMLDDVCHGRTSGCTTRAVLRRGVEIDPACVCRVHVYTWAVGVVWDWGARWVSLRCECSMSCRAPGFDSAPRY